MSDAAFPSFDAGGKYLYLHRQHRRRPRAGEQHGGLQGPRDAQRLPGRAAQRPAVAARATGATRRRSPGRQTAAPADDCADEPPRARTGRRRRPRTEERPDKEGRQGGRTSEGRKRAARPVRIDLADIDQRMLASAHPRRATTPGCRPAQGTRCSCSRGRRWTTAARTSDASCTSSTSATRKTGPAARRRGRLRPHVRTPRRCSTSSSPTRPAGRPGRQAPAARPVVHAGRRRARQAARRGRPGKPDELAGPRRDAGPRRPARGVEADLPRGLADRARLLLRPEPARCRRAGARRPRSSRTLDGPRQPRRPHLPAGGHAGRDHGAARLHRRWRAARSRSACPAACWAPTTRSRTTATASPRSIGARTGIPSCARR